MSKVRDFIQSIEDGTADEGAKEALWQLVKRWNGNAVIDYAPPKAGWTLKTKAHGHSRFVILVAEGEPEKP